MPIGHSKARAFKVALVAFLWRYSTVHFHMCHQNACPRRCIGILVTYDFLFFTVFSNVSSVRLPETMHGYIFSTVCFQKSTELACLRRCIVTLVAFFGFTWVTQSYNQLWNQWKRRHPMTTFRIGCICLTVFHCAFLNVSSNRLQER